jgi:DeoR family galactitol utilization operon repressor
VNELSETLGVSTVTVRSDLKSLEDRGFITRTHGGATPAFHHNILERERERAAEKNRIARAAAELVQDGSTIMIEAGTTTALIAKWLTGKRDIHIVTNSLLLFSYARANPALQITMTGGEFRRATESLVGPLALKTIEGLNVETAFVGTDGFGPERGLTTHLVEGAEIVKAMVARASKSVLVADSSKYGKAGFVTFLPLTAMDMVISDAELGTEAAKGLRELPLDVRLV